MVTHPERGWARSLVVVVLGWPFLSPYFSTRQDKTGRVRIDLEREPARARNPSSPIRESLLHFPVPPDPLDGEPNYPLPTSALGTLRALRREVPTKLMFILASHISSSTVSRCSRLCPGRGTLHFKRLHRQAGQLNAISDELWQRGTWLYGFGFSGIGPP
jgi:hypothetical protein